jgi:hypothetical protein
VTWFSGVPSALWRRRLRRVMRPLRSRTAWIVLGAGALMTEYSRASISRIFVAPQVGCFLRIPHDCAFDLVGEFIGVPVGPPGSLFEAFDTDLAVSIDQLVARWARDAELSAELCHGFALQCSGDESDLLIHRFTLLPWHWESSPNAKCVNDVSEFFCKLCVRYDKHPRGPNGDHSGTTLKIGPRGSHDF